MADDEELPAYDGEEEEGYIEPEDEHVEEESILTEYDQDDFFSGAVNTADSSIPFDFLEFEHSYGYDCHKYFNLCACDETVVCWASGSMVTFLDVETKQTWFRRSTTGGSIGHMTCYRTDPNYRLAIAEGREGDREPLILLYFWPQMEIDAVLRDGTANAYSMLDFSPDGELLASIGKEPDYNLTIWNWKRHKILLRTSAFTFDVNAVMFSPYCPGQLTTAGAAHIKFWKMARTFTGLKLKGELGRFGKTEICDVLGVYPMPDEKVLSGCEWGNVLVWEAGLVKVEVTQRGRKTCHKAPIIQFMLSPAGDEVTTIARDGCIRAWYWDTVEQSDPPEDDPFVELNPVAETCVPGCQIMCLKQQKDFYWYGQDGNGGVWCVDTEIDKLECAHRKVFTSHAGAVVAMAALRGHPVLVTAGEDGALHAYRESHAASQIRLSEACDMHAVSPIDVDPTSCIIMLGFEDGIMRTLLLHPERLEAITSELNINVHSSLTIHSDTSLHPDVIDLISLLKPHSKAINQISINNQRTLLVTCSKEESIFIYKLNPGAPFTLERLGLINTPNNIVYMTWKPEEEYVLLLCGQVGFIMEAVLPQVEVRKYTDITTFKLEFASYKEILVKKQYLRHRPFPEEEDLASIDEEALKAKDDDKGKDEEEEEWIGEIQLIESESMLGTTITWAEYCDEGIWVVQKGTGALLLVKPGSNKLLKYGPIPGAWCDDITALQFVCEGRYLIIGTNTGYIRVLRMPTEEEDSEEHHYLSWLNAMQKLLKELKGRRLAKEEPQPTPRIDFVDNYYLPMHDRYTGAITCLAFSSDGQRFYTCGADGNIFSYIINFSEPLMPIPESPSLLEMPKPEKVREPSTVDGELMSHEQLKQKEEYDKMMTIANAHKKRVRDQLAELAFEYSRLIKANKLLPVSQQIDVTLDPRPLVVQENELAAAKALTIRKLAHQLEASDLAYKKMHSRNIIQLDVFPFILKAIRDPQVIIRPLRQKNLSADFFSQLEEVYKMMAEAALRGRRAESVSRRAAARRQSMARPRVASFLLGLPPKYPHPLKKALRNYYLRLNRHHVQFLEWQTHLSRKPDPNALPPGAEAALKEAEETIGNRVLKTHPDYVAPPGHNTQLRVCLLRKEIYDTKHEFNEKVVELRNHKVHLVNYMKQIGERLAEIRLEIPPKLVRPPPAIPVIDDELEFPEKNLEIKPEVKLPTTARDSRKSTRTSTIAPSLTYPQPRIRQPRVNRFVPLAESRPLAASWELLKPRQDMESTPMEVEIRERRIERHLYEQDMLLADAEAAVKKFDSRLLQLQRERIRVQEKSQLLDLNLCQLHREMNVLNRFEAHEDRLAERVYVKLMQVRAVQEMIKDCEQRIEEHYAEKENLDVLCQELQRQFKKLVQDNKFADFLRRIFKKKYRPPRERTDDDSESESESSSSSEEEDEGSLDSRDIGPIRLDPNICPEGCEHDIYDKTYELRTTRHRHEQDMIEQDRMVDLLRKDIDAHNKVKRKLTVQLDKRKSELREFMLEKQSCLNEVDQVVILRYDQIRAAALRGCTTPEGLSNTVVFPEATLMKLRKRVLELQDEIKQQKQRQKINRTHLFRMNIDMKAMESQAEAMRAEMREVLTQKLGKPRKVDKTLDDLLRQMARRHKFSATLGTITQVLQQLRNWRDRHGALEKDYLTVMNKYSERLRKAAALQNNVLHHKPPRGAGRMAGDYGPAVYQRDVVRLRIVRSQQLEQIQTLRSELKSLCLKPLSPRPPLPPGIPPPDRREQIDLFMAPRSTTMGTTKKYFPIETTSIPDAPYDVNIMKLLYDALDSLHVSRDEAQQLMQELTAVLPEVLSGAKSRYEVVDTTVKKWLAKHGGDPRQYKRQVRAYDTLAALADKLLRQHVETLEGSGGHDMMSKLEHALKDVAGKHLPLHQRLGPALAALFHTTGISDIASNETMASLVNALTADDQPLTAAAIDQIQVHEVIQDIRDCGVLVDEDEIKGVVAMTIDCLKAQLISDHEAKVLEEEVEKALKESRAQSPVSRQGDTTERSLSSGTTSQHTLRSCHRTTSETSDTSKQRGDASGAESSDPGRS